VLQNWNFAVPDEYENHSQKVKSIANDLHLHRSKFSHAAPLVIVARAALAALCGWRGQTDGKARRDRLPKVQCHAYEVSFID
jgi:hypothetical protein